MALLTHCQCLCTMAVCAYLIASQTLLPKMYNVYVSLALHIWLLIFWVVDLGLVANLAAMWGRGDYCFTTYYGCTSVPERRLLARLSTLSPYIAALQSLSVRDTILTPSLYTDGSTYCYTKRDLQKRDTTTFGAYYGVLTAGAVFAAVQL